MNGVDLVRRLEQYVADGHLKPSIRTINTVPAISHMIGCGCWIEQGIYQLLMHLHFDCLTNCNLTFYYTIYINDMLRARYDISDSIGPSSSVLPHIHYWGGPSPPVPP